MRRLALLMAAGAVWLFIAAIPALADGGPHTLAINSGQASLGGDCAGCHRAHTAQAANLLKSTEPTLCIACHNGMGATTDVVDGLQYAPSGSAGTFQQTQVLGALRGGGFSYALIGSGAAVRYRHGTGTEDFTGKVPVLSSAIQHATTSVHMSLGASTQSIVWGSGALGSGAGATLTLHCTSCHNPHGNGQYRILNPRPGSASTNPSDTFTAPSVDAPVTDAVLPSGSEVRNYTVIQPATGSSLWASDVSAYGPTAGDYWRRTVPWTSGTGHYDQPNGLLFFTDEITTWCAQCHTRYHAGGGSATRPQNDPIFTYRHTTDAAPECTQCHVAHGSSAAMDPSTAPFSASAPYPDGSPSPDSRLLKVDNRGTCQMCHDPTGTITPGTYSPSGATIPSVP